MIIKDVLDYLDLNNEKYLFKGDKKIEISGFSSLFQYKEGSLTWIKNKKALSSLKVNIKDIAFAIIQEGLELEENFPNYIEVKESKLVFFSILERFFGEKKNETPIGKGTYISPQVKLGDNVIIGHNCTIDGNIIIGNNTRIFNNVNIVNNVTIGENCVIESGVSIGHDGFSYSEKDGIKKMIKHYGGVKIGKGVFIGANTCIARGTIDNTVIEDNSKIDTLCHIAHNVRINKGTTIITGSLVYGSATVGENAYVASGIIKNQITLGDGAFVGMGSVVTKDVEDNTTVVGIPAKKLK